MSTTLLDAMTLAQIKADQARARPSTCTVQRSTASSDGAGGQTVSWSNVATGVACRLAPASGRESVIAGKLSTVSVYVATLPAGQDVRQGDRLSISGRTFEVESLAAGNVDGAWETALRVVVSEVV